MSEQSFISFSLLDLASKNKRSLLLSRSSDVTSVKIFQIDSNFLKDEINTAFSETPIVVLVN
jgi:hypothetical protein